MKGIDFGGFHSYTEWGLLLSAWEIGLPAVKEEKIEIEGADGVLDYTEYFGGVKYGNRTLKFEFTKDRVVSAEEFMKLVSSISDTLHGRYIRIILDDDKEYYYIGRVKVSGFSVKKGIGTVEIEADAAPYKLRLEKTTISRTISGTAEISLTNSRKPVVPTITADTDTVIVFGSSSYAQSAGTFRIPELQLEEGGNLLTVTGTGNITFEYQEGKI